MLERHYNIHRHAHTVKTKHTGLSIKLLLAPLHSNNSQGLSLQQTFPVLPVNVLEQISLVCNVFLFSSYQRLVNSLRIQILQQAQQYSASPG